MPVKISYRNDGGVLVKATGIMTANDLIECNKELYTSPENTSAIKYQLCDFLDINDIAVSAEDIYAIAQQDKSASKVSQKLLIALVVSEDHYYGLSRMWQSQADNEFIVSRIFKELKDAEAWVTASLAKRAS